MKKSPVLLVFVVSLTLLAACMPVQPEPPVDVTSAEWKIQNATSAAPAAIAKDAAVLDWPASPDAPPMELRAGTNGWTCLPDGPLSPGNDPMCLDGAWMQWIAAFVAGEDPTLDHVGFAYMLQGGSDPSNTDPFAQGPAVGEDWVDSGPHIMVVSPDPLDPAVYSTDHTAPGPYIMWAGTPYEHLMVPVADMSME